ncbi:MAG: LuxR C-terminal-related transcriptional regulator, partial [Coriobacteriales bacterium]|nr:LuxR C-terminal-related transcriptional regulator [Coriobacteriales bacterium]
IATLYLPSFTMMFICAGALLLGAGCANLFILWQRFFSSLPPAEGNRYLILGTGLSALIYFGLHFVPLALTPFLIPTVLVPLCAITLILSTHEVDFSQPMFNDVPRRNRRLYFNTVRSYWASALCVGCLGLSNGIVRALALSDPSLGATVNITAMAGVLVSSLLLFVLWRQTSFRFDVAHSFRLVFPFVITIFLLLPVFGLAFLNIFSGLLSMIFTFSLIIMMVQCSQAARDIGINPQFIYGFFAVVVYTLQRLGFVLGTLPGDNDLRASHVFVVALGAVWVLALALFALRGRLRDAYSLLPADRQQAEEAAADGGVDNGVDDSAEAGGAVSAASAPLPAFRYEDRVFQQCALLQQHYLLSAREREVVELVARGNSVASIAARLVVTENTVRTHMKRIYRKLAIHKRQELLDMLELFE